MPSRVKTRSVGDIESFVSLVLAACEDNQTGSTLEAILVMPKVQRRAFLNKLLNDLIIERAPADLLEALACLTDDVVAEKAHEVIRNTRRIRES